MGFLGDLWDGLTDFASSAINVVVDFCTSSNNWILHGVAEFVTKIPPIFGPELSPIIALVKIVVAVVDILLEKPKDELPEELGLKAERCEQMEGLKDEDFNSTEEYIQYLRENIHVDQAEVEKLTDMDRQKYGLMGIGLYSKELGERYGMELDPAFWNAIHKSGWHPEQVSDLLTIMKAHGIENGGDLDAFLADRLESGSDEREAVYDALEDFLQKQDVKDVPVKINDMVVAYGEKESN